MPRLLCFTVGLVLLGTGIAREADDAEFTAATAARLESGAWQQLTASGRLDSLAAQLHARGWPEFIIRAVLHEQLRERFDARLREVTTAIETQYFWRGPYGTEP